MKGLTQWSLCAKFDLFFVCQLSNGKIEARSQTTILDFCDVTARVRRMTLVFRAVCIVNVYGYVWTTVTTRRYAFLDVNYPPLQAIF